MTNDRNSHKKLNLLQFTFKHLAQYKTAFFLMCILYNVISIERVVLPYMMGSIIDIMGNITDKSQWFTILKMPIIYIIMIVVFCEICFRVQGFIAAYIYPRFEANIRSQAFAYALHHSSKFFSDNYAGNVTVKVTELARFTHLNVKTVIDIFAPILISLLVSIGALYLINGNAALLYSVWIFLHMGLTLLTAKICEKYSNIAAAKFNLLHGKIVDSISNVLSIRLFARYKGERDYYKIYQDDEVQADTKAGRVAQTVQVGLSILTAIELSIILILMISEWSRGFMSIGNVAAIFAIVMNNMSLMWWFSFETINFYQNIGRANQALTLLNEPHEIKENLYAKDLIVSKGEIKFENASFSHNQKLFFAQKNITIEEGKTIGLVGHSGAGKTTFANLILREYDLDSGRILIDGQDIADVKLNSLHQNIAYITQEINLFHRSILENIRFGRPDASEEEIVEAAKSANAHDFIMKMEHAYNTDVGENGSKLSGGQRQRIAIARAILKNAQIIILDEATSALDSLTEQKIKNAITYLTESKTTIIIAHRLSTLKEVDRILVFENGVIIEDGTHDELLTLDGFYNKLWQSQNDTYELEDEDSIE